MTEGDYPAGRMQRWAYRHVERFVLKNATASAFTTDSCRTFYTGRYPEMAADNWFVLPNGYDESDFAELRDTESRRLDNGFSLLHSGYLYPQDRSPAGLFEAVAALRQRGFFDGRNFVVRFRGPGDNAHVQREAARFGIADLVEVLPNVPHKAALREMVDATALLLMQGPRFDRQVPAKAYEYLRSGRPVLALASDRSESARLMGGSGSPYLAEISSSTDIAASLERLILDVETDQASVAQASQVRLFNRRLQTGLLAQLLDGVVESDTVFART
jgi:hypothetical protein